MNGQQPQKREWKDIKEELEVALHNLEIQKAMLNAQLTEARKRSKKG